MKNVRSLDRSHLVTILVSLALGISSLQAQVNDSYLRDGKPDAIALLAPPPLPESAEQAADLVEVTAVYHASTSNDIAVAYSEKKFSIFNFTPIIGDFFQSNNLPKTTAFFERVQK